MPTAFDIVVVAAALCGILMVAGAIYLLRVGSIDLKALPAEAGKEKAALEVVMKEYRITTRYPALALFIIGLAFILGAAFLAKPTPKFVEVPIAMLLKPAPEEILDDIRVQICAEQSEVPLLQRETKYKYKHSVHPTNLWAKIQATGYHPTETLFKQDVDGNWLLEFDVNTLKKSEANFPPIEGRTIEDE